MIERFYLGTHRPHWLELTWVPLFVSHRRLREYVTLPRAAGQLALVADPHADADEWTPDDWATPPDFVRRVEEEFGAFELDPCARPATAKAPRYFTKADDGLCQPWAPARVFCNPPYSSVEGWLRKAREEAVVGALVVCLLPARPDRDWFHDLVVPYA